MITQSNTQQTEHFDNLSDQWWNDEGAFGVLHAMNPLRIKFIKQVINHYSLEKDFKKLNVLDVGCGGGILCEPLARLGANVTGIDESNRAIACAKNHAAENNLKINYLNSDIGDLTDKYDLITCLEVLEHVDDVRLLCKQLTNALKTKGILVVSTINKTILSYLVGILGAEYLTGVVPVGTHDWKKFIEPARLIEIFAEYSLTPIQLSGISYSLLRKDWVLSERTNMNYIIALKYI